MNGQLSLFFLIISFLTFSQSDAQSIVWNDHDQVHLPLDTMHFSFDFSQSDNTEWLCFKFLGYRNKEVVKRIYRLTDKDCVLDVVVPAFLTSGDYIVEVYPLGKSGKLSEFTLTVLAPSSISSLSVSDDAGDYYNGDSKGEGVAFSNKIVGRIITSETQNKNERVFLQSFGDTNLIRLANTDSDGLFEFNVDLFGINEIMIASSDKNRGDYSIELIHNPYDQFSKNGNSVVAKPSKRNAALSKDDLKILMIKYANKIIEKEDDIDNIFFDTEIKADDYKSLSSVEEFVRELVPFKRLRNTGGESRIFLLDKRTSTYYKEEPLIMVNGWVVTELEQIFNIGIEKLKSVEIGYAGNRYIGNYGSLALHGIINFNTNDPDFYPQNRYLETITGLLICE